MITLIIWDYLGTLYNPSTLSLYPSTKSLLNTLGTNFTQILVSSPGGSTEDRILQIKDFGIEKYFKKIYIQNKDEKLFLEICRNLGLDPKDGVAIGDNKDNEIRIGNNLGMHTIYIRDFLNDSGSDINQNALLDHIGSIEN